ncbi:MAG: 2-oxoglutarate dehydrogenase complex dihydrolipoyllysine-residue succinyltransferase [bacterium]
MTSDVKVTELPESVQEATLIKWHKKTGDTVRRNEKLADIETDKIVIEIPATASGILSRILKKEGDTLKRGDAIASIDDSGASAATPKQAKASAPAPVTVPGKPPSVRTETSAPPAPSPVEEVAAPAAATEPEPIGVDLAPAVRKMIVENMIDIAQLVGTGKDGRITKADVLRFLEHSPMVSRKLGEVAPVPELKVETVSVPTDRPEQRVRMTRLRQRIAERLVEAQHSAAILTTFNEVNMHAVTALRNRYKEPFEEEHHIKLGLMSFFVKAAVEALTKHPVINASVDGQDIVYHGYFDLGIAVSSPRGLVVPVLRNADRLSIADIETSIADLAKRAEDGKLAMEDLAGGTFTISNGGVFGSLLSTPILNPPQSAILGMHRIQPRPVVENDQVVIRPMMYLALSYDHRIIDGREAVLFLVAIKDAIEDPTRLLLQI